MATSTGRERRRFLLRLGLLVPLILGCEEALIVPGGNEVVSLVLNPSSFPMAVGEVMRPDVLPLNAEGRPIVGGPVTWASSDSSVASVDSMGLIRGEWEGKAQITARVGGVVGSADVTITPVAASEWREHSCFVALSGAIWCWGRGGNGELGNGLRNSSPVPVRVQLDEPVASVSVGASHSCGVTSSGAGYCWGRGAEGQLGDSATMTQVVPVKIGFGLSFRSLSAGGRHTCGVIAGGETRCWGWAAHGQLGNGATVAVTTPVPLEGNIRFEQLSAGARHSCGVVSDGRAYCWGDNRQGQLGDGTLTDRSIPTPVQTELRFSSVSAGARHTCAVALDGRGWCWGDNRQGQHGTGTLTSSATPQEISGAPDFRLVSVSSGGSHSCGIHVDGHAYCWGAGQFGQLGHGATILVANPFPVAHELFTEVVAGAGHSCGVAQDQSALCWGLNAYGQLGLGDFGDRTAPLHVAGQLRFGRWGG